MGNDERIASKEHLVALMQAGSSWQEAAAQADFIRFVQEVQQVW